MYCGLDFGTFNSMRVIEEDFEIHLNKAVFEMTMETIVSSLLQIAKKFPLSLSSTPNTKDPFLNSKESLKK